jgi:hypothetical protein
MIGITHVLTQHEHNYCDHYADAHYHEDNLNCDIFHYHQSVSDGPVFFSYQFLNSEIRSNDQINVFRLISIGKREIISLRAPPATA